LVPLVIFLVIRCFRHKHISHNVHTGKTTYKNHKMFNYDWLQFFVIWHCGNWIIATSLRLYFLLKEIGEKAAHKMLIWNWLKASIWPCFLPQWPSFTCFYHFMQHWKTKVFGIIFDKNSDQIKILSRLFLFVPDWQIKYFQLKHVWSTQEFLLFN